MLCVLSDAYLRPDYAPNLDSGRFANDQLVEGEMDFARKNCLICDFPDILVLKLDKGRIHKYHCPLCKSYYVCSSVVDEIKELTLSECLSLMSSNPPDNKIMCIKYDSVNGINIYYDNEIKS